MSWILIANRAGARIVDRQQQDLSLVEEIPHEQGRLRDKQIDTDRQGRSFNSVGAAGHALSPSETAHEHDAKAFARELADKLRTERMNGSFERLVLIAEPHFLGLLREALDDGTARLVIASEAKDLAQVGLRDLARHLPELPTALA
jgi:protein required for attachment to host cells